jgi:hypothetical protein
MSPPPNGKYQMNREGFFCIQSGKDFCGCILQKKEKNQVSREQ